MDGKIKIIIKELGRVNARLRSLNADKYDKELLNEIAALIAEKHVQRAKYIVNPKPPAYELFENQAN